MNVEKLEFIATEAQRTVSALKVEIEALQQQWETVAAGDDIAEADTLEAALVVLQQDLRRGTVKAAHAASNFEKAKAEATRQTGQQAADACAQIEQDLAKQLQAIQTKADELSDMLAALGDTFSTGWEECRRIAKESGVSVKHINLTVPQFGALRAQLARPEGLVRAYQMRRDM